MAKKKCDSCNAIMINGIFCHEIGCPDAWKDYKKKCKNCGKEFKPKEKFQDCCTKGCYKEYWNV